MTTCPECGAVANGNASCASCRSRWDGGDPWRHDGPRAKHGAYTTVPPEFDRLWERVQRELLPELRKRFGR